MSRSSLCLRPVQVVRYLPGQLLPGRYYAIVKRVVIAVLDLVARFKPADCAAHALDPSNTVVETDVANRGAVIEYAGVLEDIDADAGALWCNLSQQVGRYMHQRWGRSRHGFRYSLVVPVPCHPLFSRYIVGVSECSRVAGCAHKSSCYIIDMAGCPQTGAVPVHNDRPALADSVQ